jgi:hypothetical protein
VWVDPAAAQLLRHAAQAAVMDVTCPILQLVASMLLSVGVVHSGGRFPQSEPRAPVVTRRWPLAPEDMKIDLGVAYIT